MQEEQANGNPLPQKRHAKDCTKIPESCRFTEGIFRISEHICNLNRFALQQNSAAYTAASWCIYQGLDVFIELGRVTVACCGVSIARLSRSVGGFEPCRPRIAERQTRPGY